MYCDNCGTRNDFDAEFCKKCGKGLKQKSNYFKQILKKILKEKNKIILILTILLFIILPMIIIYNNKSTTKYKKYMRKQNFSCQKLVCTKKENGYKTTVNLKHNRLYYKVVKLNEEVTFMYAGKDIGNFKIKDSLEVFNCLFLNSKIKEETCSSNLTTAGYNKYMKKMQSIYEETNKIIKKANIKF